MKSLLLEGKLLASKFEDEFKTRVKKISEKGITPSLATILVGDDPASATYVKMKQAACQRVGLDSKKVELPMRTTTNQLLGRIEELNDDDSVKGILLQHPVPSGIDERACFDAIDAAKDVDGVTTLGFGRMSMGVPAYGSATPMGIMRIIRYYDIGVEGKHAVVVGRSPILGKPMSMMLLAANATVTICHSKTKGLSDIIKTADVVVGAVGRPEFIRAEWIKDDAIVIDAGYHPGGVGDIELEPLKNRVFAYTPVPGGVGPMTINTLIEQTIQSAEKN